MYVIYIIKLLILACNIQTILSTDNMKLSDKRSCANKECSVPISEAKTLLHFATPTQGVLSFKAKEKVTIYSKEAGENTNLWGAEINGKRGYIPKNLVQEDKILVKGPVRFVENVEELQRTEIKPDNVKKPYEVIDRTTVYTGSSEEIPKVPLLNSQVEDVVIKSGAIEIQPDLIKTSEVQNLDTSHAVINEIESNKEPISSEEIPTKINAENVREILNKTSKVDESLSDVNIAFKNASENPVNIETKEEVDVSQTANVLNTENNDTTQLENEKKSIDKASNSQNPLAEKAALEPEVQMNETLNNTVQEKLENPERSETKHAFIETPASAQYLMGNSSSYEKRENNAMGVADEVEDTFELPDFLIKDEPENNVSPVENKDYNQSDLIQEIHNNIKTDNADDEMPFEKQTIDSVVNVLETSNIVEDVKSDFITTEIPEENKDDDLKSDLIQENADYEQEIHNTIETDNADDEIPFEKQTIDSVDNILETTNIVEDVASNLDDFITTERPEEMTAGFFSNIFSNLFGNVSNIEETFQNDKQNIVKNDNSIYNEQKSSLYEETGQDYLLSNIDHPSCPSSDELNCPFNAEPLKHTENFPSVQEISNSLNELDLADFFDIILVLSITGGTTVIFFLGYLLIDKCRREGPLIAKINNLEKALFVSQKENILLLEKSSELDSKHLIDEQYIEEIEKLRCELEESLTAQSNLQEQIQSLEKELENSTEVGLELNKMISDMLSAQNGSDVLTTHVEQLQNQLVDQHNDIAKYKERLNEKTTENHELQLEFDINKKKLNDLQTEINNMLLNVLKIEEERDENQQKYENTITALNKKSHQDNVKFNTEIQTLNSDLEKANKLNVDISRNFEMKSKEFDLLKDSMKELKTMKNNSDTLRALLDMSSVKAELHQLKTENLALNDNLKVEEEKTYTFEKQAEIAIQETQLLKVRFDETDRERVEAQTKLEVLGNYFKEKEGQLQKELNKHEAMWNEKQGEASSTVERIKFMQEELQNYKSQNETLKHEIMSQEVNLKSQISVLEKKSHEYWLNARQVERKLEDAKQEAAQLRNRLTLRERTYLSDEKTNGIMDQHHHMQPLSPLHHMGGLGMDSVGGLIVGGDSTASPPPPMIYAGVHRDHMTSSPHNLHSMPPHPPPFLPPPPFMPPPPMNGPPTPMFMHPLPPMPPPSLTQGTGGSMFGPPGDHRPPPLGRISSPPLPDRGRDRSGVCYSPSSSTVRTYSPYDDRHSPPSPSYDDDDDDLDDIYTRRSGQRRYYTNNYTSRHLDSPPHLHRSGGTTKNGAKGSTMSSGGSANPTASAEKGNSTTAASGQYHHNTNV